MTYVKGTSFLCYAFAGMSTRIAIVDAGGLEVLDLPGDAPAVVLLHEGLGSVRLWRDFPAALAERDRRARRRVLPLRPRRLRPAAAPAHAALHARGGAGGAARRAPRHRDRRARPRRPQRRRVDRAHPRRRPPGARGRRDRTARVRRGRCASPRSARPSAPTRRTGCARAWPATIAIPTPPSTAGTTSGCIPSFRDWDITDVLPEITCPLLLIQGEHDQYGTMAQLDAIEARVSRAGRARASAGAARPAPRGAGGDADRRGELRAPDR